MISLCLDVVPERSGSLGSYVKFGLGPVVHSFFRDTLGVVSYHADRGGTRGNILAIELVPGMEEIQKEHEDDIVTVLRNESGLTTQDAEWVLEAAFRGRKTDASAG